VCIIYNFTCRKTSKLYWSSFCRCWICQYIS